MLPKTAEYALRAAVWLGRDPNQTQSADHLAERTQVPRRYLHKVLQDLVRAKIVRSQSGPGGGYALATFPAYLAGDSDWDAREHNIAALALNEYLVDQGLDHPVRYSNEL